MTEKFTGESLVAQIIIGTSLLIAWEAAGRYSASFAFMLGSPTAVLSEFGKMLFDEGLAWHFLVTGTEAAVGLTIGTFAGLALGLSLWFSDRAARVSRPFVIVLGSLPVIAFAPLMIIWFGIGMEMKIALAALSTLFIAFNQAHRGVNAVSGGYIDIMRGMNAPSRQTFVKVVVPGSMDWVFSSMRLNVGFGLLGAFIGEFIASDKGSPVSLARRIQRRTVLTEQRTSLAMVLSVILASANATIAPRRTGAEIRLSDTTVGYRQSSALL